MWHQTALRNSQQLKESYIGISYYVRANCRYLAKSCGKSPFSGSRVYRNLHTSISCLAVRSDRRNLRTNPDIIPAEGVIRKAARKNVAQDNTSTGVEGFLPEPPGRTAVVAGGMITQKQSIVSTEVLDYLENYKERNQLVADATHWQFLENSRDPPRLNDPPVRVKVYGYITAKRPGREQDFIRIAAPHLRRTIQVVVQHKSEIDLTGIADADSIGVEPVASGETEKTAAPPALHEGMRLGTSLSDEDDNRENKNNKQRLAKLKPHTPVLVSGRIVRVERDDKPNKATEAESGPQKHSTSETIDSNMANSLAETKSSARATKVMMDRSIGLVAEIRHLEIYADSIKILNQLPRPIPKNGIDPGPENRHLQIRINSQLRNALRYRSRVSAVARKFLFRRGFDEVETPLLFKSTPEGAREFIVPTRTKGFAYCLPQSPQQYKQLLMASGIPRYFQFAKCFRDEDMRTDRQPEFTQIDLEMSFARREDVMIIVERLVAQHIWPAVTFQTPFPKTLEDDPPGYEDYTSTTRLLFPQYTYQTAMTLYGSDKPDVRFGSEIHRVDSWIHEDLKRMLTSLEDPVLEMLKIDMRGQDTRTAAKFLTTFLDNPSSSGYMSNPDGAPGVAVFDPHKPLNGLASFGYEGSSRVEETLEPNPGDIIVIQARQNKPFAGGSTVLGNLRRDLYNAAISQDLLESPKSDSFIWITDFPLFSPVDGNEANPGQGGSVGLCSTHHPFTAPNSGQDLTKLFSDPLSLTGDHYDLVINGVEVGGGSRRIHEAPLQEIIFRDVLKMPESKIKDFAHLLNALDSGCPPHAGFALGLDRLMALALRKPSVRDVIAFPKWGYDGAAEDKMVRSPSRLDEATLATYHLAFKSDSKAPKHQGEKVSLKA